MPIYNGIEFIDESIGSILSQTYDNWELIVGINGHNENSEIFKIAKQFEKKSDKIRVYDFFNLKGKSATLNEMLKYCKYDYIAILDVDDIWFPTKLQNQIFFVGSYDVIGSRCIHFADSDMIPNIPVRDISNFDFTKVNPIINSSVIIKKDLCFWNKDNDGVEDYDLWLRLRFHNAKFYNCPQILVRHRVHESSSFNTQNHSLKINNMIRTYNNSL